MEIHNILRLQWYVLIRNTVRHNGPIFSAMLDLYERPKPEPGQYEACSSCDAPAHEVAGAALAAIVEPPDCDDLVEGNVNVTLSGATICDGLIEQRRALCGGRAHRTSRIVKHRLSPGTFEVQTCANSTQTNPTSDSVSQRPTPARWPTASAMV
jgi:hypothetical protein